MINTILWDIDDTLLNFHQSEAWAIKECMQICGMKEIDDSALESYRQINHEYWQKLEQGKIGKQELLSARFRDFFELEKIEGDPEKFNELYQCKLGEKVFPNDDGITLCQKLKRRFKQYAVSNGTKLAQYKKLKLSGLDQIFDGIFISEEVGYEKPSTEFFNSVFETIGKEKRKTSVLIGDSLTSDMFGGNRAGIKCMWYNPNSTVNKKDIHIDYEIINLWDIEEKLNNN